MGDILLMACAVLGCALFVRIYILSCPEAVD